MYKLLLSILLVRCGSELLLTEYGNGVAGSPGIRSTVSDVTLPVFDTSSRRSFIFDGTLTPPAVELLQFSARVSGVLRVYVDDHLVLDDAAEGCDRAVVGWAGWPVRIAAASVPLRIEFSHVSSTCTTPLLVFSWHGNITALAPVPALALALPPTAGPRAEYASLRERLYEPVVPWQTYYAPSMGAHTLQPSGLVVHLSVGRSDGAAYLGDVRVFPSFQPAFVRAGGHSYNGSDYTAVHVMSWAAEGPAPLNATVSLFTTALTAVGDGAACNGTEGNGGVRCDLVVLAACAGADCSQLVLVVSATYAWAGSGTVSGNASALVASPDGFTPTFVLAGTPPQLASGFDAFPSPSLALPFSSRADLPWPGPGGGNDLAVAVVSTGAVRGVAETVAAIAAARSRYDAGAARFGAASSLYEPMRAVLAWNTLYAHFVGVYTPVSRNWYPDADSIGTFVWDVAFAAIMMATDASDARARDLACANVITTVLSRTMSGMVPNYISGQVGTYDRTEPAVVGWTVRVLRDRLGVSWLPALLLDALVGWHDWSHDTRRNTGVLAPGGADGLADAISLGSGATSPAGLNTPHTLAAARYESGLDNSPQYDGDDGQCSGPTCPCTFNTTTSLMNLYDVAFTAYHIVDADALANLAVALNRSDVLPRLADRAARAAGALERLWTGTAYANALIDGTPVPRWAPTVFAPMLAGVVPRVRLAPMLSMLGDPRTFCVNDSHTGSGGPRGALLLNFGTPGAPGAVSCVSDTCLVDAVLANAGAGAQLQAAVQLPPAAGGQAPLTQYVTASGARALATPAFAPADPAYSPLRVEAACALVQSPEAPVPITLWQKLPPPPGGICSTRSGFDYVGDDLSNASIASAAGCCTLCNVTARCTAWKWASGDARCFLKTGLPLPPVACADCVVGSASPPPAATVYATCASAACNASAAAAGMTPAAAGPMCYGARVDSPDDWPCAVPLPAIGRSDAAFADQVYWRGRAWAPQAFLVWLGLQRYSDVPEAAEARRMLASMSSRVFLRQVDLFGQVNENLDGLLGLGSDSSRADSYYHWGALNGFIALIEAGGFPASVLVTPAPQ